MELQDSVLTAFMARIFVTLMATKSVFVISVRQIFLTLKKIDYSRFLSAQLIPTHSPWHVAVVRVSSRGQL